MRTDGQREKRRVMRKITVAFRDLVNAVNDREELFKQYQTNIIISAIVSGQYLVPVCTCLCDLYRELIWYVWQWRDLFLYKLLKENIGMCDI